MSNELRPMDNIINPAGESPAQRLIRQTGEKNMYVDHANSVQQVFNIQNAVFGSSLPADATAAPAQVKWDTEYYNLFVCGQELEPNEQVLISRSRALDYTDPDTREAFIPLTDKALARIKVFPSLFMCEPRKYYAQAEPDEVVYLGIITDIREQDNGVRVRWERKMTIPLQTIVEISCDLGMRSMSKAITELNYSHWAIKHVNLLEEFRYAGIDMMVF